MKLNYVLGLVLLSFLLVSCTPSDDSELNNTIDLTDDPDKITIYFFWGVGCPHCESEKLFLEELKNDYPGIEVKMFETWKDSENVKLFQELAKSYGFSAQGVPATFIGDKYWVGYADYMGEEMEAQVNYCLNNECINAGDKLI